MSAVVHAQQLSRRFGRRWALARVDLEVMPGERMLIVGSNGSGKTTLLRTLATAQLPTQGQLRLFGLDPERELTAIRTRLALLSHQPALYEDLSGTENIRILLQLLGRGEEAPEPWLEKSGLDPRSDPVRGYSAGMRKRLSFARLLAQKPELALIDEPYGQLDPSGFGLVDRLLQDLTDQGATVVVASHHVDRARHLCDRAVLLNEGLVRWSGPAVDIDRAWDAVHQVGEA